jgi:tetratricopeptide (TPR) repeat protein
MRRVVYIGNCQMQALVALHRRFVVPVSGDVPLLVDPYQALSDLDREAIASADLIVGQVTHDRSVDDLTALGGSAPRHLVPTLGGSFYWPFANQSHINHLKYGPYVGDLGDGFLNRMIRRGVPPDEAVQRYLDLDINSVVNLDRLLEVNIDQQRDRDAWTGYCFAEMIADRFRDEYLFLTPYHLNLALSRRWAAEIWQRIGVGAEPIARLERELTSPPFPAIARPIHPSVVRHFGLRFLGDEPRFRFPAEASSITFAQFARRYVRSEWNESLDEAVRLTFVRRADAALEKLQVGVEQNPGSVDGVRLLSDRLVQLKRPDEAIAIVRRAITIDPAEPYLHARLAVMLGGIGDLAGAEAAIRHAIELAPDMDVFHRRLSHFLIAQGRMTEAEAPARMAVALDKQTPDNFTHLGTLLTRTNQLDAAEAALRQSLALDSRRPASYLSLSRVLQLQGKFDAAIDVARAALELMPAHTPGSHQLSEVQEAAGQTDEAETTLSGGIAAAPWWAPKSYVWLADLLTRLNRLDEALEAVRRAIALEPGNVVARARLFELLDRAGRTDEAETALRDAIATAPRNARFHHALIGLLDRSGRLDAALEAANHAAELGTLDAHGHLQLSDRLTRAGRPAEAEAMRRRAVEMSPDDPRLHHRMSVLLQGKGDMDGSLQSILRAVELAPDRAELHIRHSQLLTLYGEIEPALETIRRAVALNPCDATARAHLGNLLARTERFDEAEAAFAQALALAPDHKGIQQALERMRSRRATSP